MISFAHATAKSAWKLLCQWSNISKRFEISNRFEFFSGLRLQQQKSKVKVNGFNGQFVKENGKQLNNHVAILYVEQVST